MARLDFPPDKSLGALLLVPAEDLSLVCSLSPALEPLVFIGLKGVCSAAQGSVSFPDEMASALVLSREGLRYLGESSTAGLPIELRALIVRGLPFGDKEAAHLVRCQSLEVVSLLESALSDDGLSSLGQIPTLQELDISGAFRFAFPGRILESPIEEVVAWRKGLPRMEGSGLDHLARLPQLRHLNLSDREFDLGHLAALSDLPALQRLDLDRVTDLSTRRPATSVRLHNLLEFSACGSQVDLSEVLVWLKGVEELRLSEVALEEEALPLFERLWHLKKLDLSMATWEGTLSALVLPSGLEELDLGGTNSNGLEISGTVRHNLACMRKLYLDSTRTDDGGVTSLGSLTSLEHVDLSRTNVTDGALLHLTQMRSLRSVNLAETKATADGIRAFERERPDIDVVCVIDSIRSLMVRTPVTVDPT